MGNDRRRPSAGDVAEQHSIQSMFREVNDRIEQISDHFGPSDEPLRIVCECGDLECAQLLELTASEYQALRQSPTRFAVAAGHESARGEQVVARNERFVTVEALDAA